MRNKKITGILLLAIMTAIWGGTFPLIKTLLLYLSPFEILCLRFLFASIIAAPILFLKRSIIKRNIAKLTLIGFSLWLAYASQTIGLKYTSSAKSAFITGLYIIFAPVISSIANKDKIKPRLVLSIIFALLGLFIMSGITITEASNINIGDIITLISAISFAIQIVLTNIFVKNIDMSLIAGFQMLIMFILSYISNGLKINFSYHPLIMISLIFLGVVGGYLAILAETYGLKYLNTGSASIIFALEPIFALIFSVIFLKEVIDLRKFIGFILIFFAIINIASDLNNE